MTQQFPQSVGQSIIDRPAGGRVGCCIAPRWRAADALLGVAGALGALLLAACGGGGTTTNPAPTATTVTPAPVTVPTTPATPVTPTTPASPPPRPLLPASTPAAFPSRLTPEASSNWALLDIDADAAWSNGSAGQGVLVGVIDSGADGMHPELAGRIAAASKDFVASRNRLFDVERPHGSMIAAAIAGNFNSQYSVGVAFAATVLALRSDQTNGSYYDAETSDAIDYAVAQGAHVINMSLGANMANTAAFQAALRRATDAGVIFVISAGNNSGLQVSYPARYAADSRYGGLILAVGAHDDAGQFMSFSNQAGDALDQYLAAPGSEVRVPSFGSADCAPSATCIVAGTSISAPYVTGAIATLLSSFPGLAPRDVVRLLLASAEDMGDAGVDRVWGHGLLNLARAYQPMGSLSLPLGSGSVTIGTQLGVAGAAFGDALTRDTAAWRAVAFDAFDRSFEVNLSSSWQPAPRAQVNLAAAAAAIPSLPGARSPVTPATLPIVGGFAGYEREVPQARANDVAARSSISLGAGIAATISANLTPVPPLTLLESRGHLSTIGTSTGAALTRSFGSARLTVLAEAMASEPNRQFVGASRQAYAMQYQHDLDALSGRLRLGWLREQGALLGLAWLPEVGASPHAASSFIGTGMRWTPVPRLSIAAEAELGNTAPQLSGWINVASPLLTSAFGADISWAATPRAIARGNRAAVGRWFLALRQPLRIERGSLALTLPTATAYGRASLGQTTRLLNAAPSGRELEFGIGYELQAAAPFMARLEFSYVRDPGHVAAAPAERAIALQVRLPLP